MRDDMTTIYETIAAIQRHEAEKRERNRAMTMKHIPEAIELFEQLKAFWMAPTMKLLQFPVEHQEAA